MLHPDKLDSRRALDTRPPVVPTFLPGDIAVVWRMMEGGGILGKRAHHRCVCMGTVRGNCWFALPGSVVKASPEQLRPPARELRRAWRSEEAELRTKLVNFDELPCHRFQDITNGERPPGEEEDLVEEETVLGNDI